MKFNINQKYFGDPPFCFRDPVPGCDPPFGKRCCSLYIYMYIYTHLWSYTMGVPPLCISVVRLLITLIYNCVPSFVTMGLNPVGAGEGAEAMEG